MLEFFGGLFNVVDPTLPTFAGDVRWARNAVGVDVHDVILGHLVHAHIQLFHNPLPTTLPVHVLPKICALQTGRRGTRILKKSE